MGDQPIQMEAGCAPVGSHGPLGVCGGGGLLVQPFKEVPHFSIFLAGHVPKMCPGAKITSIATINYIYQLLFHHPSSIIFQWVYGPQLQRMSRSALEITELLWYQFRYRHCHFQVLEGPKITSMIVQRDMNTTRGAVGPPPLLEGAIQITGYLYNLRSTNELKNI